MRGVAEEVGVSAPSVSGWESGNRQPSAPMIPKYAAAIGITPTQLLDILELK